jgi:adenylate cyclase
MMNHLRQVSIGVRELRLLSGSVLFSYILTHLLNHTLGLVSLNAAERGLAIAKSVWYSTPGTAILYGAAALHVSLALRTIYLRQHWRLPPIEYVRLAAGFSLPLLLIGHVVTTRLAYALHSAEPKYTSVVSSLVSSGNEGWQLALLAPGWLHGCLGLWISIARLDPGREIRWVFFSAVVLIPCLAAAGFLSMSAELAMPDAQAPSLAAPALESAARQNLAFWRQAVLNAYLTAVAAALLAGPVRRSVVRLIGNARR